MIFCIWFPLIHICANGSTHFLPTVVFVMVVSSVLLCLYILHNILWHSSPLTFYLTFAFFWSSPLLYIPLLVSFPFSFSDSFLFFHFSLFFLVFFLSAFLTHLFTCCLFFDSLHTPCVFCVLSLSLCMSFFFIPSLVHPLGFFLWMQDVCLWWPIAIALQLQR